ncbi:MAG: DUF2304 domain-containing protein [Acidobacteriota bacterium]|nr:DUF2304 domain-containing protein [Acidobacteriota bacterium]
MVAHHIEPSRIQVLAIIGSILFLLFVIELIRKRKIQDAYGLLWIFFGVVFIVFSVWRQGLEVIARLLGIFYTPAAFLLILIMAIFLILIQYSLVISRLSENGKTLNQQIGILRLEQKELRDQVARLNDEKRSAGTP